MNIIEEHFRQAIENVEKLKKLHKEGKELISAKITIHYIVPASPKGVELNKLINGFNRLLKGQGMFVLDEGTVEMSVNEIDDLISRTININKQNVHRILENFSMTDKTEDKDDAEFFRILAKDSLPQ